MTRSASGAGDTPIRTIFVALFPTACARRKRHIASARAGLEMAWESLQWQGEAGTGSLREALASSGPPLQSATLHGRGAARPAAWEVPYRGSVLRGSALAAQIDDWLARGIIESSAAVALHRCLKNPEWFDLSDRTMVLLGAGSEAGPLRWLARWRARIVAVDIPAEPVWRRIAAIVADGNGILVAPVRRATRHRMTKRHGWPRPASTC